MILFFVLLTLSALQASDFLSMFTAQVSPDIHHLCLSILPTTSFHPLQSLLCGAPVQQPELKQLLRSTGLLHLFVVSGAHLIWLEHWLCRLHAPFFLRVLGWTFFSLACGWQPPVVRGWIGLLLMKMEPRWTPSLRADQHVLLTGLITLIFFPLWGNSLSLALSWVAAFSLSLSFPKGWKGELMKCAAVWFFLLPLLAPWSPASPSTIFVNFLLAPVFSLFLLPLGIVCVLLPPVLPLFDFLFSCFVRILALLPISSPEATGRAPTSWGLWGWVILFHTLTHFVSTSKRRRAS
ncbi:MAG TPA: ComEC/Rec2 family competence protein [Pseudobdellovibrionaceae bacterium]|nr:ComEC/Rec2 family competence protein [Pseudobdellovibrionaceae bacterium]